MCAPNVQWASTGWTLIILTTPRWNPSKLFQLLALNWLDLAWVALIMQSLIIQPHCCWLGPVLQHELFLHALMIKKNLLAWTVWYVSYCSDLSPAHIRRWCETEIINTSVFMFVSSHRSELYSYVLSSLKGAASKMAGEYGGLVGVRLKPEHSRTQRCVVDTVGPVDSHP
jgi:hypothetical protein